MSVQATSPATIAPLGLRPSFGFGDRLGLATAGHARAVRESGGDIAPIYPQQSIREMTRTGRTPEQVMADALTGLNAAGFSGTCGADADHLKTTADIDRTAAAGFVFFTIDPSDFVDTAADGYDPATLRRQYDSIRSEVDWVSQYVGKVVRLDGSGQLEFTPAACERAAVKYGRAINQTVALAQHIRSVQEQHNRPFEIELSVDETPHPTTAEEHYIVVDQCLRRGLMNLVSVAPRYVGDFEKGVDFKGSLAAFTASLAEHAAIARTLGPYKLSLHSGSDKLSIYPTFARLTRGRYHVKTAGTSYLEALRVVTRVDVSLFRRVVRLARERYEADRLTYHVSATLSDVPADGSAGNLEASYLGRWDDTPLGTGLSSPGRQILHCTFGSVLSHPELKAEMFAVLRNNVDLYEEILADHFGRHLRALQPR